MGTFSGLSLSLIQITLIGLFLFLKIGLRPFPPLAVALGCHPDRPVRKFKCFAVYWRLAITRYIYASSIHFRPTKAPGHHSGYMAKKLGKNTALVDLPNLTSGPNTLQITHQTPLIYLYKFLYVLPELRSFKNVSGRFNLFAKILKVTFLLDKIFFICLISSSLLIKLFTGLCPIGK